MLKTLKVIIALPFVLPMVTATLFTMWIAARIARTDRKRAAWLLFRLATLARRMPAGKAKPESKRRLVAMMVAPALLLQGAPWEKVETWCETGGYAKMAFEFYFAEQRFAEARHAAQFWCEQTEAEVAGREAEMREFFAKYGDDLSPPKRGEIMVAAQNAELAAWKADPYGKRPGTLTLFHRVSPRIAPFFRYYDVHLALQATCWIGTRDPNSKTIRAEFARQRERGNYLGLPQFRLGEDALAALGMSAAEIETARRRALGQA